MRDTLQELHKGKMLLGMYVAISYWHIPDLSNPPPILAIVVGVAIVVFCHDWKAGMEILLGSIKII